MKRALQNILQQITKATSKQNLFVTKNIFSLLNNNFDTSIVCLSF